MANYHVTKRKDGWQAKKEGAVRASGIFNTQKEAEKAAKQFSANSGRWRSAYSRERWKNS